MVIKKDSDGLRYVSLMTIHSGRNRTRKRCRLAEMVFDETAARTDAS